MNIETSDERLLRTERERDEARAEVERVRESNEDSVAMVERLGAELARLRERAEEAERERDKVTGQLNNERADHVRIAVAAGVVYESDYSGPVRGPVLAVVREIEALVKDRAAADRLRSLDQAVLAYRRKERALLGLPDEALEEDHLQAIADLKSKVTLLNTKLADKRRVLLHETEMVATREEVDGAKAAKAELARLRAAANERAITELEHVRKYGWNCERVTQVMAFADSRIAALRAETPAAPQPAPSGGVERAIAEMQRVLAVALNSETVAQLAQFATKRLEDLRAEQQAAPVPPPVTPPADAPNDPTKNVCAIRRRSDGYWWECNGEHGAGWNDKRIRQAWTHRAAHVEVERMKASGVRDDVEVVELAPKPCGEDDPKTVAALALEAVKRDITLAVREKYSNPNLPTIYCDNNGNGWRINYDEMHTLLSGRIKQARSGTWFWPKPVEPADAPSRPHIKALLMDVVNHQPVREVPLPVLRLLRELVEIVDALAARWGAQ